MISTNNRPHWTSFPKCPCFSSLTILQIFRRPASNTCWEQKIHFYGTFYLYFNEIKFVSFESDNVVTFSYHKPLVYVVLFCFFVSYPAPFVLFHGVFSLSQHPAPHIDNGSAEYNIYFLSELKFDVRTNKSRTGEKVGEKRKGSFTDWYSFSNRYSCKKRKTFLIF